MRIKLPNDLKDKRVNFEQYAMLQEKMCRNILAKWHETRSMLIQPHHVNSWCVFFRLVSEYRFL